MTSLLNLSTAFSVFVSSRGGRRAAVAGLASGSGFSIAGVVGVEVSTSLSIGLVVGFDVGVGIGVVVPLLTTCSETPVGV